MKKKMLYNFTVAIFIIATACPLAKAQTIGGNDVKVTEHNTDAETNIRMTVADNGWIFLTSHSGAGTNKSSVKIFRSKDGGVNYEKLQEWSPSADDYQYQDFDIEVTGKDEFTIKVWLVAILNKPGENKSKLTVFRWDVNLQNAIRVFHKDFLDSKLYSVSLASNYRSPAPGGIGGNPFALALAYTGYQQVPNRSFLSYVFSEDGGNNFTSKEMIYTQPEEEKIGRVDLSLGSTSKELLSNWPVMGVVFEMDKQKLLTSLEPIAQRNIGFLSNYVNYDPVSTWAAPIKLNTSSHVYNPKIQMMLDDADNTIYGEKCFNFMIAFNNYVREPGQADWDVTFIYPKPSFRYAAGHTPSLSDLEQKKIEPIDRDQNHPAIGYDKINGNYLFTYRERKKDNTYILKYKWFYFDRIWNQTFWSSASTYTSSANALYTPQIDIDLIKRQACWSWVESVPDKKIVWTDTQWNASSGVEDILQESMMQLHPNPAKEYILIRLPAEGNHKAVLYDMQGRTLPAFAFNGREYRLSLQDFAKGIYLLRIITSTGESYKGKFVIE